MDRRTLLVAGAATVALTAASMTAVAAAQNRPGHTRWSGTGMMRGPVPASTCQGPSSPPGQQVTVMLGDMTGGSMMGGRSMMDGGWSGGSLRGGRWMMLRAVPQTVTAGTVSLVAYNRGARTHELVVLPLASGVPAGTRTVGADNTVDETESVGEASKSCGAGRGDGITAGAVGWITLDLKPGRYELICNLPGHYAAGMYSELDVT